VLLKQRVLISFKSRLDTFWQHQKLVYNYKSELHGTGSRREFNWKFWYVLIKCMWEAGLQALPVPVEPLHLRHSLTHSLIVTQW